MQIKQLETILNETLVNLPFMYGKISRVLIYKQHDKTSIIKITDQDKSVFDLDIVHLSIEYDHFGYKNTQSIKSKVAKNPENLLKSLINSIVSFLKKDDNYCSSKINKRIEQAETFLEAFKIKNSNYFNHNLVYPTTYGLGYYCLLLNEVKFNEINKKISQFLDKRKIDFKNEFSDALWVYRFKFKSLKQDNIKLLDNLILQL